jgi:hypothetical protein
MIHDQRIRTAAGILRGYMLKCKTMSLKRRFVQWRQTIGMQSFLTVTFRRAVLSKTINRVIRNWQRRSIVRYLHLWKQLLFSQKQRKALSVKEGGLIESLMTDQKVFSECLEDDAKMAINIC